jgi:glycosyltransferase involved in cell wall biosynthesis
LIYVGKGYFYAQQLQTNFIINIQKIKLLLLTPSLECGGAEKYVSIVCNNLDKQIFDVTLLVVNNSNPFFLIDSSVAVIDLHKKKVRHALPKIVQHIKKLQPNIVYSTANHLNLLLAIFKFRLPVSTKFIAWETSIVSINHTFSTFPKLYNLLLKKFYKKIPLVVCQSNYMQQDLIANYGFLPQQTKVIYTGIDEAKTIIARNKNTKPHFLTVARLSPEKGIDKILKALSLLTFDFIYTIIGDGIEKDKLKQLVAIFKLEGKVIFAGQKQNPFTTITQANLFLMGSKYEGFPTSLLEATSYGIPCVAYNAPGGISEIIKEEINGFLVKENSAVTFAQVIEKAVVYNFDAKKIQQQTQLNFGLQNSIQQLQNFFIAVCN